MHYRTDGEGYVRRVEQRGERVEELAEGSPLPLSPQQREVLRVGSIRRRYVREGNI